VAEEEMQFALKVKVVILIRNVKILPHHNLPHLNKYLSLLLVKIDGNYIYNIN
jgi:hypothetical protein